MRRRNGRGREDAVLGLGLVAGAALALGWLLTRPDPFEKYRAQQVVAKSGGGVLVASSGTKSVSADTLIALALNHVGERYTLGAHVPKGDASFRGPWDCAEFCSWLVYQTTGRIVGARGKTPATAEAWTGHWLDDMRAGRVAAADVALAMQTPGAFLLRFPQQGAPGHIALSTGGGGTVEAMSARLGVRASRSTGRRWDAGILVPGVVLGQPVYVAPTPTPSVIREGSRGDLVARVQRVLGLTADGVFGPATLRAVLAWQSSNGLIADGEVGPNTLRAMGVA